MADLSPLDFLPSHMRQKLTEERMALLRGLTVATLEARALRLAIENAMKELSHPNSNYPSSVSEILQAALDRPERP